MKTTDCLCRKIIKEIATYLPFVLVGWMLIGVGYFLHVDKERHQPPPTVEIEMMDKDDKIIWGYSFQKSKDRESIEISAPTDVLPKNYFNALVGVNPKDIKHADRVVVRLK